MSTRTCPLVITVTSGKGGVGKTNIAVNLATCLAHTENVILLDADLGLANIDVLLGVTPPHDILQIFNNSLSIQDILYSTPYGFDILPASSGVEEISTLGTGQKLELMNAFDDVQVAPDYLIVDTGAGINDTVIYFNIASQERIIVITPEPTSITDAYALIKILKSEYSIENFKICLNMIRDSYSAKKIFRRLCEACDKFLTGVSLDLVAIIPMDLSVRQAVMQQTPFVVSYPNSYAAKALKQFAAVVPTWKVHQVTDGNIKFFWKKFLFRTDI